MDESFEKYAKELEAITKEIPMRKAITAKRKGIHKVIDKIVMGRFVWTEAFAFIGIIQTIIIFTALVPQSVYTMNEFLSWAHIPITLPVGFSATFTMLLIVFIFIFGFVTVRYMRTATVGAEYGAKTSPGYFLIWKKLESLEEKVRKLDEDNHNRK